jgi:hypothetical protein
MSSKLEEVSMYQFPLSLTVKLRIWKKVQPRAGSCGILGGSKWQDCSECLFLLPVLTTAGTRAEGTLVPDVLSGLSLSPPNELIEDILTTFWSRTIKAELCSFVMKFWCPQYSEDMNVVRFRTGRYFSVRWNFCRSKAHS